MRNTDELRLPNVDRDTHALREQLMTLRLEAARKRRQSARSGCANGLTKDMTSAVKLLHRSATRKWVGEKIFMLASVHGVPCNIFRLGLVWGDTQQGAL